MTLTRIAKMSSERNRFSVWDPVAKVAGSVLGPDDHAEVSFGGGGSPPRGSLF